MGWLQGLSAWQLAIVCSGFFVLVTWLGIVFVRPFLRLFLRRQPGVNELVSYSSAGFSLLYGLLLGLLSVAAYQNVEKINGFVDNEAASLGLLYLSTSSYPEPHRGELQALLRDYTLYVIHKDWPAHREGRILEGGVARLAVFRETLMGFEPDTANQTILQEHTLGTFNDLVRGRVERLGGVSLSIPGEFWYVVLIGAAINILLIWLLDMRFLAHLILGGLVAFFLGVMIFLIAAMDHPMRGAVAIDAAAYQRIYDTLMAADETV
jgi:hypothetical protein